VDHVAAPDSAAELVVEGRVQGVGFRDFVQRRAEMLGLAGYVMNLPDGRVYVHVEGPRALIEELARQVEKGPRLARVLRVGVRWVPPTGRFTSFTIRYAEADA
jgi:acylphosphatase